MEIYSLPHIFVNKQFAAGSLCRNSFIYCWKFILKHWRVYEKQEIQRNRNEMINNKEPRAEGNDKVLLTVGDLEGKKTQTQYKQCGSPSVWGWLPVGLIGSTI